MGTTPILAIPYVDPAAKPAAYPAADKAKADRLEAVLTGTGAAFGWARQTAAQSVPNGVLTTLTGLVLDTASTGVTLSGTSLRCPTAGLYLVTAAVTFTHNPTNGRALFIRRGGTVVLRVVSAVGDNTTGTAAGSLVLPCAAGDLIDVGAYQSSGAALSTDPNSNGCSFQLARL
jgi:hypothetical protein